jgi:molecular chaperone GrpE (heat shock protein)
MKELAELLVEKYAKEKNLSEEDKKKLVSALLAEEDSDFEKVSSRLVGFAEMLSKLKDAPEPVRNAVATIGTSLLGYTIASDPVSEGVRDAAKYVAKIKFIDSAFKNNENEAVKELKAALEGLKAKLEEIETRKKSEELEALKEELRTMIDSLTERIDTLESRISAPQPQNNNSKPENIISEAKRVADTAKQILMEMGYRVEPASVPIHELNKILEQKKKEILESISPEELKSLLESRGYKVVGGPVRWEDVEKMLEDVKKRAYEEALEDKKIEMAANVLRDVTSRFIDLFKPAVQFWIESQTKKGEK